MIAPNLQFDMQVPPYFSRNAIHYGPDTWLEVRGVGVQRRAATIDPGPGTSGADRPAAGRIGGSNAPQGGVIGA